MLSTLQPHGHPHTISYSLCHSLAYLFFIYSFFVCCFFFFQAEDGIRDYKVTGVQTCALPILPFMRLHLPLVGATTADQGRDQIIIVTITVLLCSTRMAIISRPYATLRLKRSEEHTSELQSPCNLVCRLLLEIHISTHHT